MENSEGFVKLVGKLVRCGCLFVGCYRMKTEFVIGIGSYRIGRGWICMYVFVRERVERERIVVLCEAKEKGAKSGSSNEYKCNDPRLNASSCGVTGGDVVCFLFLAVPTYALRA